MAGGPDRLIQRSMVQCVDEGTANITAALKEKGMWETTLMVWTSDNGGQISEVGSKPVALTLWL